MTRFGRAQYGHLTAVELGELSQYSSAAVSLHGELKELATPLLEMHGAWWFVCYEWSFPQHLSVVCIAMGWREKLLEIASMENPTSVLLGAVTEEMVSDETPLKGRGPEELAAFINLIVALSNSVQAISYFGLSINELLEKAKSGDHASFLRAISVDPTVLQTVIGSQLLASAQLRDDRAFLRGIQKAMKGPHLARKRNQHLRAMHRVLAETEALSHCTMDELYGLVGERLKLYSDRGEDPQKGLAALLSTMTKEATR